MSHITTEDPATLRLPFKEKLSYGIGDLASNILLDIGTLYLLKFYTDGSGAALAPMAALSFDLEILYRLYRYGNRHHVGFPTQDRSKR